MAKIILIIIGIAVVVILLTRKGREKVVRPVQNKVVGICAIALDQTIRKNANKKKTLAFIQEKAHSTSSGQGVSNEEIREYLGVSRRSAIRYLDELEKEDKIEQVGDIGRGVVYRLR